MIMMISRRIYGTHLMADHLYLIKPRKCMNIVKSIDYDSYTKQSLYFSL